MAEGVRKAFNTSIGLSTTGVAGPTGGTRKTPVGTVFVGLADERGILAKKLNLKGNRRGIKEKAAEEALKFLWSRLMSSKRESGQESDDAEKARISIGQLRQSDESRVVMIRKAPKGIPNRKGRLGIFPASFNPPTMAHLALVRGAMKKGGLNEILVLLDVQAMDKKPVEAGFGDRLTMLKEVFRKSPNVSIGLSSHGLFLDKIEPLRRFYPDPVEFFFIVGFDTIVRVFDRKYYRNRKKSLDELFARCHFLVANRGELEQRAFERIFRKRENKQYVDRVSYFTLPPKFSKLSSTLVRKRIAKNQTVDQLVPASVLQFIRRKGLYTSLSSC
jgi:nicotinate (nicotinamide) nucleotide adenylyltransferase